MASIFGINMSSVAHSKTSLITSHRNTSDINIMSKNINESFKEKRSSILVMKSIDLQVLKSVAKVDDCWCAGGAPLAIYIGDTNKIRDWDLFFTDSSSIIQMQRLLMNLGFELSVDTEYALTLKKSGVLVQLIHGQIFNSLEHIFSTFDFSASCIAVDGTDFFYEKQTIESIKDKSLEFYGTSNMQHVLHRLTKYGAKGFRPSKEFGPAFYDFVKEDIKNIKPSYHAKIKKGGTYES